jgi:hypothetical protein
MGKSKLVGLCLGTILVGGSLTHARKMDTDVLARPIGCHVSSWSDYFRSKGTGPRRSARRRGPTR